jgi:ABC-type taurine transport system ATPase subunit
VCVCVCVCVFARAIEQLSSEEILLFYARIKGVPSSEEHAHVQDVLHKVGLDQYGRRLSKDLSGGMRRRLSIGVALVGDPRVIFLDEPTTYVCTREPYHVLLSVGWSLGWLVGWLVGCSLDIVAQWFGSRNSSPSVECDA